MRSWVRQARSGRRGRAGYVPIMPTYSGTGQGQAGSSRDKQGQLPHYVYSRLVCKDQKHPQNIRNTKVVKLVFKKSCIRETKHLSTDADSSTDAIGGWTNYFFPLLFPKDSESLKILDIRLREVGLKRPLKKTENQRRPEKVKKKTFFCAAI